MRPATHLLSPSLGRGCRAGGWWYNIGGGRSRDQSSMRASLTLFQCIVRARYDGLRGEEDREFGDQVGVDHGHLGQATSESEVL